MNKKRQNQHQILQQALDAVEHETGVQLSIVDREAVIDGQQVDAVVRLQPGDITLHAKIKTWAAHKNLGAIMRQIQKLPGNALLVADYINPNMAETLRERNIQFIDTVGNIFINQLPVYLYVAGNRPAKPPPAVLKSDAHRAFEPRGLIVTYAFLLHPELVNAPYRTIADITGVAQGTVGWVIQALRAGKYLRTNNRNQDRRLTHYEELIIKWVEAWPLKLKPKQFIGEFIATKPDWRKDIDITDYDAYWGGEIAAAHYTDYLTPQTVEIYIPENEVNVFIRNNQLRKTTDAATEHDRLIKLHTPFWTPQLEVAAGQNARFVHPLLAYADLLESGDPRNIETANLLYDERIAGYHG